MTFQSVVVLERSCETATGCTSSTPTQHTAAAEGPLPHSLLQSIYPDIEVDLFDESTAVVQVQAQLVQAQALL